MSRFGDFINRKLEVASQCPECGCGYTNWREVCLCTHYGCECAEPDSLHTVRGQRGHEFDRGQNPPDNDECMPAHGYAGEPRGVVWGTVNPDGSVTARGFRYDESYSDDSAVHPVDSLVSYNAENNAWVHMATGQTTERQREIDAERERPMSMQMIDPSKIQWADWRIRDGLNPAAVAYYREHPNGRFDSNYDGPPQVELGPNGELWGQNGLHRATAAQMEGRPLKANVYRGEEQSGKDAARADTPPPPTAGADVNEATKGAIQGVSTITPTGLAASAASGVTGKDIKSPVATAAGSTSGGGTGVSHAEEGNAQIQQAGQDIEAAMGAIQEIVSNLEAAQQNLTGAAEGSQHSEADTAMGALQEAVSAANDLQQQVGAAKQSVEDVRL